MNDWMSTGWLFAGGAAVGTLLATFWSHVKSFYAQIASRVVMTITVSGYEAEAMLCYLKTKFKASRWGARSYLGWMLYVRSKQRVRIVPMEVTPPGGRFFWRGWRALWCFKAKDAPEGLEAGVNTHDFDIESLSLCFLRGTFDADQLIIDATEWFNEQIVDNTETEGRRHFVRHIYGTAGKMLGDMHPGYARGAHGGPTSSTDIRACLRYRSLIWPFSDLGPEPTKAGCAVDALALDASALQLVEEARRWKTSEQWYKQRSVPWRRGWLLYGEPGTGKTALVRAVAEDLDLPVYLFDLASLYNNELQMEWSKMLANVPCMALIEDIDAVFDKRRNVVGRDRQHLSFDCLLNCLDGIERADGLFVVITTNRIEKIDSALGVPSGDVGSSRPGRIDRILEMKSLDDSGRRKIARRIVQQWPQYWEELIDAGQDDTGAQFQERCARFALKLHYDTADQPTESAV